MISVVGVDSTTKTLAESNAALSTSGTLTVTDVDLSDAVNPSVVSVVASDTTTGLGSDNAALKAMLSVTPGSIAANPGDTNNLNWSFNSTPEAFNYLAAGQKLTLTYTVKATDSQSVDSNPQTVTIVITGSEDAPVISVVGVDSTTKTLAESNAALSTSGTLTVTDADLSDAVNPSLLSVVASDTTTGLGSDNAALKAMLSVTPGSIAANPGDTNNLNWSFNSTPEAFNYLAAGQKLTLTYTVKATDSQSVDSNPQTVTIVITGSEDAPVISVVGVDSTTKTLAESNAALSTSGTLTVTDADLSDTVSPSVVSVVASDTTTGLGSDNAALKAMLSVTPGSIAANPGDTNNLNWSFNSTPEAFNYLAAGQKLTLTYTVKATDSQSVDSNPQTVTIVITGSEDAPVISVVGVDSTTKTLAESDAALSTSGTLTVTDVDLSDAVNPSVVSVVASDTTTGLGSDNAALKAMLSVTPGSIAANPGDTNNLNWSFNSTPEAFNYLAAGQKLTLTYTVKATDSQSVDSNPQTVTIVITGSEDAPVISVVGVDSTTKTLAESNAALSTSGTLTVTDADLSDAVSPSVVSVVASDTTTGLGSDNAALKAMLSVTPGSIAANPGDTNNLNWSFNSTPEAFNYLAAGQKLTLTYTVKATDSQSVDSNPQTVTIVITGSEDAPVISVVGVDSTTKTLAESNAALSTSGTLTVTDVDLSDAVNPSVVSVVASDTTTGLGSDNAALKAMLSVTPGSIAANPGDTNNLNWSFNSTPEAFNYLAAGQKLTLTYTVKATDSQSVDSNPQTVTIVITGSEDAPVISVVGVDSTTKTLAESNAALSTSGTLTVTDVDLSDAVNPSVVSVVASDTTTGLGSDNAALKAMLSVTPGSIAANPGDTNNLNWSFNSTTGSLQLPGGGPEADADLHGQGHRQPERRQQSADGDHCHHRHQRRAGAGCEQNSGFRCRDSGRRCAGQRDNRRHIGFQSRLTFRRCGQ